jgi:hypothetical protein
VGLSQKESADFVYENYTADHVEKGIKALKVAGEMQSRKVKGAFHHNTN